MGILRKVRNVGRKAIIHDEMKCEWDAHSARDLVVCLDDFNGHVGRHIDGSDSVHGGYGVGLRNVKERMLTCFAWTKNCECQIHCSKER